MTTEKKTITITMSERAPLKIDAASWPVIASANRHDGKVRCQANNEWEIIVRQHADGRRLVYGWHDRGGGGQYAGFRPSFAGYLIPGPQRDANGSPVEMNSSGQSVGLARQADETIRAIRRVAGVIGDDRLAAECIGDLPAEVLS